MVIDELDRVRAALADAAVHWAGKAIQTQHAADAARYAVVASDVAGLVAKVEQLRWSLLPQTTGGPLDV